VTFGPANRPLDVRLCSIVEDDGGKFFGVQGYLSAGNLDNWNSRVLSVFSHKATVRPGGWVWLKTAARISARRTLPSRVSKKFLKLHVHVHRY
jgi:hypothetical protein